MAGPYDVYTEEFDCTFHYCCKHLGQLPSQSPWAATAWGTHLPAGRARI